MQCRESVDIYNKKYIEAINDYKEIEKLLPESRETEDDSG